MAKTASDLHADIYNLLDRVIETGVPLEIERKGKIVRIAADSGRRVWPAWQYVTISLLATPMSSCIWIAQKNGSPESPRYPCAGVA